MSTQIMRQLWSIIEATQVVTLLQMDDTSLVQWLIKQTSKQVLLESHELDFLDEYIKTKLTLIRDLADQRSS